jgi:hypothetical protein
MKFTFFLLAAITLLAVSCSKSGSGKPEISIQSINTIIPYSGELDAVLKFTDKKGDLGNGTFTAIIVNLNQQPPTNLLADTIVSAIPSFPSNTSGQLEFTLPAGNFQEHATQNDTLRIRFSATDASGISSDTILSPIIVALYQ